MTCQSSSSTSTIYAMIASKTNVSKLDSQRSQTQMDQQQQKKNLSLIAETAKSSETTANKNNNYDLHRKSNKLLTMPPSKEANGATIFDLRFDDRQRIAKLISELANANEQVEMLQYRIKQNEEDSRLKQNKLARRLELLSDRCQYLVSEHPLQTDLKSSGRADTDRKKEEVNKKLQELQESNQQLTLKIHSLVEANDQLHNNLTSVEQKYMRCTEDNQRLKLILRKIQQREEMLLTHNKYLNTELDEEKSKQTSIRSKSPNHNIEILPAKRNESFTSLSRPHLIKFNQNINGILLSRHPSMTTASHLDVLIVKFLDGKKQTLPHQSLNIPTPPQQICHESSGDFHTVEQTNGNSFHESLLYEPHYLVIPSIKSPVTTKISKYLAPHASEGYNNEYGGSDYNSFPSYSLPEQQKLNPTHPTSSESLSTLQFHNGEETILRELFFTF